MGKDFSYIKELPKEGKCRNKFFLFEVFQLRMDIMSDREVTNQQRMDHLDLQAPFYERPQKHLVMVSHEL